MLLSAKVAQSAGMAVRPARPAWCVLPDTRVLAACVADPADVVVLTPDFERLGRLCMPAPVVALAAVGELSLFVVSLRDGQVLICNVDEKSLVPMRRKQRDAAFAASQLSQGDSQTESEKRASPARADGSCPTSISPGQTSLTAQVDGAQAASSRQPQHQGTPHTPAQSTHLARPVSRLLLQDCSSPVLLIAVARTKPWLVLAALANGRVVAWRVGRHGGTGGLRMNDAKPEVFSAKTVHLPQANARVTAISTTVVASGSISVPASVARVVMALDSGVAIVFDIDAVPRNSCSQESFAIRTTPLRLSCDYGRILGVSWAPEGRILYAGEDDSVYCASASESDSRRFIVGCHQSYAADVCCRGEHVVSAGWDGRLIMWSLHNLRDDGCYVFDEEDGNVLDELDPGKTYWRVEWPQPNVLLIGACESAVGKCTLHRVELKRSVR